MIKIEQAESVNLLGLILKNIIQKNLQKPRIAQMVNGLSSSINIKAGRMKANIRFKDGDIIISSGFSERADASVKGTMSAFIDMGLRRNIIKRFLKGDVKIGGNVLKLLPLLRLLSI